MTKICFRKFPGKFSKLSRRLPQIRIKETYSCDKKTKVYEVTRSDLEIVPGQKWFDVFSQKLIKQRKLLLIMVEEIDLYCYESDFSSEDDDEDSIRGDGIKPFHFDGKIQSRLRKYGKNLCVTREKTSSGEYFADGKPLRNNEQIVQKKPLRNWFKRILFERFGIFQ